jgi:hypothetical protein
MTLQIADAIRARVSNISAAGNVNLSELAEGR